MSQFIELDLKVHWDDLEEMMHDIVSGCVDEKEFSRAEVEERIKEETDFSVYARHMIIEMCLARYRRIREETVGDCRSEIKS